MTTVTAPQNTTTPKIDPSTAATSVSYSTAAIASSSTHITQTDNSQIQTSSKSSHISRTDNTHVLSTQSVVPSKAPTTSGNLNWWKECYRLLLKPLNIGTTFMQVQLISLCEIINLCAYVNLNNSDKQSGIELRICRSLLKSKETLNSSLHSIF